MWGKSLSFSDFSKNNNINIHTIIILYPIVIQLEAFPTIHYRCVQVLHNLVYTVHIINKNKFIKTKLQAFVFKFKINIFKHIIKINIIYYCLWKLKIPADAFMSCSGAVSCVWDHANFGVKNINIYKRHRLIIEKIYFSLFYTTFS